MDASSKIKMHHSSTLLRVGASSYSGGDFDTLLMHQLALVYHVLITVGEEKE